MDKSRSNKSKRQSKRGKPIALSDFQQQADELLQKTTPVNIPGGKRHSSRSNTPPKELDLPKRSSVNGNQVNLSSVCSMVEYEKLTLFL